MFEAGQMPPEVVQALINREKQALVGRLLPGVVHNLSGALQMVRLPLDLLELLLAQGEISGAAKKLDSISTGLSRLGHEIEMMASKSPSQAAGAPLDLAELARQELDFWRADMFFKHELTLDSRLPAGPLLVHGDQMDLALAINALVANAVEAMREGDKSQAVLTVSVYQAPGRRGLVICDSGPGPDPDLIGSMFDPFVTGKPQGHDGLGLFLARQALAPHDGRVSWSPEHAGFVLDLPQP